MTNPSPIPVPPNVPSTPNPTLNEALLRLVRLVLTLASGAGFAWGATLNNDAAATMIVSVILAAGNVAWTLIEMYQHAHAKNVIANISAVAGRPLQPK